MMSQKKHQQLQSNDELFSDPKKRFFYPSWQDALLVESKKIFGTTMDCAEVFN